MPSRPRVVRVPLPALCLSFALLVSVSASAATWHPLAEGMYWEYRAPGGAQQISTITGTTTLFGRTLYVKSVTGGPDAGLRNFWQIAPDGSVLLGGFDNPAASLALAYEPPIVLLATPPALGLTWTTHSVAYEIPSMTEFATIDIHWEVLEDLVLDLPAGSFHAYGVGQVMPVAALARGPGRAFTLDGRVVSDQSAAVASAAADWYSEDVGVVQFRSSDLFQLVSFDLTTPAATTAWGRIKRIYR